MVVSWSREKRDAPLLGGVGEDVEEAIPLGAHLLRLREEACLGRSSAVESLGDSGRPWRCSVLGSTDVGWLGAKAAVVGPSRWRAAGSGGLGAAVGLCWCGPPAAELGI